jgi:acylphosphatase
MKLNVKVLISGRVQGVWFRANTKNKAEQLGLTGWVKNTSDGKVEAEFEGEEEIIIKMLEWCKGGSPSAKVTNIEINRKSPKNEYDNFEIRY